MAFRDGQSQQQSQRSNARKHHRINMHSQAYHNGKNKGGFQPVNSFSNNHHGANANSIGNPYNHMNNNAVQGFEQYNHIKGTLNGNGAMQYQGQALASQHKSMPQQSLPFQQAQFVHHAPELTPAQLAYRKFQSEKPLRDAIISFRAQQNYERSIVWDKHWRHLVRVWNSDEYRAKNQFVEKTMEDWEKEEKRDWTRFRLAALEKDNEERHAAIGRLEAVNKEEHKAAIKEGRKSGVKKVKKSHLPVYSERETEYEQLFGDHHSIFGPDDVLYASAPNFNIPYTSNPPTVQPPAAPAQDTFNRGAKRGREDDDVQVDEHIVKRPRSAGVDAFTTVPSAKVGPQQLPDAIDTAVVTQATSAAAISNGPSANEEAIFESLQAPSSPEVNTPSREFATFPANDEVLSTKIDLSSSEHISVAQSPSSPVGLRSSSPGSIPPASAFPHNEPIATNTSRTSPGVASIYSSPTSTNSPGLSSEASFYSRASPLSSTGSVAAIHSNKKRSRQSDDESEEAPPVKRQYIRAKSLKSPPGPTTATIHDFATDAKVVNASSSAAAVGASMPASSPHDSVLRPVQAEEEEL